MNKVVFIALVALMCVLLATDATRTRTQQNKTVYKKGYCGPNICESCTFDAAKNIWTCYLKSKTYKCLGCTQALAPSIPRDWRPGQPVISCDGGKCLY